MMMTLTPPAELSSSAADTPLTMGDWLLVWGNRDGHLPQRQPALGWCVERSSADWTLYRTATGEGWRGAPCLRVDHGWQTAWLMGELYGADPATAVAQVLAGAAGAGSLNGHFLLLAHDRAANEWHIWTNRHATIHAYLGQGGSRLAVGTFLPAVTEASGRTALDWEGLTTFFGFGYFGGDRTHLAGVRILRPATHYRFGATGRLESESRTWDWHHTPDEHRSYDDTVDAFAECFETVMGEMTARGRIAVPISGGLDSRSTVAALPPGQYHDRLWAYSYGYGLDSAETAIAGRVAAARGLAFDAYTIQPYLFDRLTAINAAVEGFEDVTQCRQAAVVDVIDRQADALIAAHLGDLYLDDMGLAAMTTLSTSELNDLVLKKVRKKGSPWLLEHVCRRHLGAAEAETIMRENVAAELERLKMIAEPDFRLKAYKVDQWVARWTTVALRMYQVAAFPRLPFNDTRLTDFFATVPTTMLSGRRLQIDYLRRYAPDLARITWQATGRDLFDDGRAGWGDQARRAAARGWRLLRGRRVIEQNWQVQFAGSAGQQGLRDWLLRPGLALHEYVAPSIIAELLAAFAHDPYTHKRAYTVSMLVSFSAWLEGHYRPLGAVA